MKKRLLILTFVLSSVIAGVSISQKAHAVVDPGKDKHLKGCTTTDPDGNIVSLGNTCETGTANCVANPCSGV